MRRLSSFVFLLGFLLFVLLLRMVDLNATWALLKAANPYWVIAAILFLLPEICLKGLRLKALSQTFHSRLTFRQSVWIYLAGQPLAGVTPSKLGDIVRVLGISRWGGLRPHSAFAVHAADKVFDLLALGLFALTGLITLIVGNQHQESAMATLLGVASGILLMALFLNPQWMQLVIKPLLLFLAPRKLGEQLKAHGREFYKDLLSLFQPARRVVFPFGLSLLSWFVVLVRAYFCALALGLSLSLGQIILILPVVIVIEFIPITILGFGTREAALFLFFASPQLSTSGLVSFSLLTVLAGPLLTSIMGIPFAMKLSQTVGAKE